MSGHVFIVRGDLRKLACDARLIPVSRRARPGDEWFPEGYDGARQGTRFEDDGPRVQLLREAAPTRPALWLCQVGSWGKPVSWFVDGAVEFLDAAAAEIGASGRPPCLVGADHSWPCPSSELGRVEPQPERAKSCKNFSPDSSRSRIARGLTGVNSMSHSYASMPPLTPLPRPNEPSDPIGRQT